MNDKAHALPTVSQYCFPLQPLFDRAVLTFVFYLLVIYSTVRTVQYMQ